MANYRRRRRRQQRAARNVSYGRKPIGQYRAAKAAPRATISRRSSKKSSVLGTVKRTLRGPDIQSRLRRSLHKSATVRSYQELKGRVRKLGGCKPRPDSRKAGKSKGSGGGAARKFIPWC